MLAGDGIDRHRPGQPRHHLRGYRRATLLWRQLLRLRRAAVPRRGAHLGVGQTAGQRVPPCTAGRRQDLPGPHRSPDGRIIDLDHGPGGHGPRALSLDGQWPHLACCSGGGRDRPGHEPGRSVDLVCGPSAGRSLQVDGRRPRLDPRLQRNAGYGHPPHQPGNCSLVSRCPLRGHPGHWRGCGTWRAADLPHRRRRRHLAGGRCKERQLQHDLLVRPDAGGPSTEPRPPESRGRCRVVHLRRRRTDLSAVLVQTTCMSISTIWSSTP